MNGIILGARGSGKRTLLSSLSQSMILLNKPDHEFTSNNENLGNLHPNIIGWLKDGQLSFDNVPYTALYKFTLRAPKNKSMMEQLMFWEDHSEVTSACYGVEYINPDGVLFEDAIIEHLKTSEYLILTENITRIHDLDPTTEHRNHFENLAHLFLQMYSLDCPLKRVAIVLTGCTETSEPLLERSLKIFGEKIIEVFKTFCERDTKFAFFMTDALITDSSDYPLQLDNWKPSNTIAPFLFATQGIHDVPVLTLAELEVKWKL